MGLIAHPNLECGLTGLSPLKWLSGIRVQCLLPDVADTGIWLQNGTSSIQPPLMMSPENVSSFFLYAKLLLIYFPILPFLQ